MEGKGREGKGREGSLRCVRLRCSRVVILIPAKIIFITLY